MITPPAIPQTHSNGRRRKIWIIVGVLLSPVILLFAAYVWFQASNLSAIRKLEARARKAGQPVTLAELSASLPSVSDRDNAALDLIELWSEEQPEFWSAFKRKEPLPELPEVVTDPALPYVGKAKAPFTNALSPEVLNAAQDYLRIQSNHMQRVISAMEKPRFKFPVDFEKGMGALLPHLSLIKYDARRFALQSVVAVDRGDTSGAIEAAEHTAGVGQLLEEEPLLISQLVRVACLAICLENVGHIVNRAQLKDEDLVRLQQLVESMPRTNTLQQALVGERATGYSIFSSREGGAQLAEVTQGETSAQNYRLGLMLLAVTGLKGPDQRLYLETMERAIAIAGKEEPTPAIELEPLFNTVAARCQKFPPKIITGLSLPALGRAGSRMAKLEAMQRAALLAIAVERYRLAKGELPVLLNDLVPTYVPRVYADPFDGQPLRFSPMRNGYVIYSIGEDFKDNSGAERVPGAKSNEGSDICFRVEHPRTKPAGAAH